MSLHRDGKVPGFTPKYGCKTLVWFEQHNYMHEAIKREKQVKRWRRKWKLELIEKDNPSWRNLHVDLM